MRLCLAVRAQFCFFQSFCSAQALQLEEAFIRASDLQVWHRRETCCRLRSMRSYTWDLKTQHCNQSTCGEP